MLAATRISEVQSDGTARLDQSSRAGSPVHWTAKRYRGLSIGSGFDHRRFDGTVQSVFARALNIQLEGDRLVALVASDLPNGRKGAGILRYRPNIKWAKDSGKEPERSKAQYPWLWDWDGQSLDFMGDSKFVPQSRHNNCHYTNRTKQAARETAEKGGN